MSRNEIDPATIHREDEPEGFVLDFQEAPLQKKPKATAIRYSSEKDRIRKAEMKAMVLSLYRSDVDRKTIVSEVNAQFNANLREEQVTKFVSDNVKYWKTKSLLFIEERQALVLARLDQLEVLAIEGYFASMEGRETTSYEQLINNLKKKDPATENKKRAKAANVEEAQAEWREMTNDWRDTNAKQIGMEFGDLPDMIEETDNRIKTLQRIESNPAGDPRWVAIMLECNKERARLWSLYQRPDVKNDDQEMASMPDDVREQRLVSILHAAKARVNPNMGHLAKPQPLGGFTEKDPTEDLGDDEW